MVRATTRPPPGSTPALLPPQAVGDLHFSSPEGELRGGVKQASKASRRAKGVRMFSNLTRSHGPVMWGTPPHVGVEGTTEPQPGPAVVALWGKNRYQLVSKPFS